MIIDVRQVSKEFEKTIAIDRVALQVKPGEIFGLVGPDGAGKTTLIRMLTGIVEPSAGEILVLDSSDLERIKPGLGYVPQKFSLYGDLTVMENIRFIGLMYGAPRPKVEALAEEILAFTKLLPFKERLAENLSGGMKQKLALAAGLMHKPKLFFLDEPTTGVDPVSRREFWQMLYHLNQTENMTIFVSTPYMDEAELCTQIAFMHQGRITACSSPQELRNSYPNRLLELETAAKGIKDYLRNCPILDINPFGDKYHLVVKDPDAAMAAVEDALTKAGIPITMLREIPPTMEDVFVALTSEVASL